MTLLTPGILYITRALAFPSFFAVGVVAVRRFLETHASLVLPTWIFVIISILSLPTLITCRILLRDWRQRRDAAAIGARIAPRVKGKWFANLDLLKMMMNNYYKGYPADGLIDILKDEGPVFNMNILWENMVFTCQPEHIQLILATDFNNYTKGGRFQRNMSPVLGAGVFNSDGDMWKFHRSMTRPFFSRDKITHFDIFDRHADSAISLMKTRFHAGYAVDFQVCFSVVPLLDLIGRFTLDSATEFLFGSCVNSLAAGLPYPHNVAPTVVSGSATPNSISLGTLLSPNASAFSLARDFSKAFLEAQEAVGSRERFSMIWPLLEIHKDRTKEPMKVINAFIQPIVDEAVTKMKSQKELRQMSGLAVDNDENETLLDHLVKQTDDPVVLKDETLNILIAGRDTTAATLTFVIYFLSMYPETMDRLRKEILEKVGPSQRPTYDDIRDMKFLRAVINETLRLYPVVPFNVRECTHATTWPSPDPTQPPIYIPAGAIVPWSVFMMHRRKDLWGPDAEVFDPDRFLDERLKKYLTPRPFIFLAFNAGPRICLGQQFAYNEMSFFLVRLIQNFTSFTHFPELCPPEFQVPSEWKSFSGRKGIDKFFPKMTLTMYSGGGLWIKAQEAE
ncbi:cytochrome P450 monooxygenase pc-1 [Lentinula lateritia]|uniref:Cytochrome P450 monooxygenase pc-1 n=1 Tax=Lentinula aff. lateritia TaxID=2804960 RepID=A0ACC1TMK9_9AGAR|nr:cytochrome P450 monooxygenase pc-1 [Lentinula aff. lateritia]KAJ3847890.1 cytochrome P450 monooxygenase pc-1 [Lentinula lateritia]